MKDIVTTLPGIEIVHYYRGDLTNEVLNSIILAIGKKLKRLKESTAAIRQINRIIIELLQNVIYYKGVLHDVYQKHPPELMLVRWDKHYMIATRNPIPIEKKEKLKNYIDTLNNMTGEELSKKYKEILKNGQFNQQGGAGLGLLNVILKTVNKHLKYDFKPIDKNFVYFDIYVLI